VRHSMMPAPDLSLNSFSWVVEISIFICRQG
jgi:hypothetical protein